MLANVNQMPAVECQAGFVLHSLSCIYSLLFVTSPYQYPKAWLSALGNHSTQASNVLVVGRLLRFSASSGI